MKNKKAQNIKIIKNEEKPETPEILADSLVRIADGFTSLIKQGITHRGLVTLLMDMPGMSQVRRNDIDLVLENLTRLKSYYIRK